MVGTLPGRTQGLGLITEPLLADLGLDRVTYATLNFWATIIGADFAVGIGRVQDRLGTRAVLSGIAVALGLVVCLMSQTSTFAALAISVTLTRGLGQSALSVVSLAMVGRRFVERMDMAMAVYSVVLSVGFMLAFPLVGSLVQTWGWRRAWLAVGAALLVLWHRPPGGCSAKTTVRAASMSWRRPMIATSFTWREACRHRRSGSSRSARRCTASSPQESACSTSRSSPSGLRAGVYYQTLVVTAMTALAGNFLGGWLAARVSLTQLLAASLFVLAAGLAVCRT